MIVGGFILTTDMGDARACGRPVSVFMHVCLVGKSRGLLSQEYTGLSDSSYAITVCLK